MRREACLECLDPSKIFAHCRIIFAPAAAAGRRWKVEEPRNQAAHLIRLVSTATKLPYYGGVYPQFPRRHCHHRHHPTIHDWIQHTNIYVLSSQLTAAAGGQNTRRSHSYFRRWLAASGLWAGLGLGGKVESSVVTSNNQGPI